MDSLVSHLPMPTFGDHPDYCSERGAQALKEKIEAYWRERGGNVTVRVQQMGFHPAIRAVRYELRSDMVNGAPRTNLEAVSGTAECAI